MSVKDVALRLGESEEMVRALLEELEKRGSIRSYESCGGACEGCPVGASCRPGGEKIYFAIK